MESNCSNLGSLHLLTLQYPLLANYTPPPEEPRPADTPAYDPQLVENSIPVSQRRHPELRGLIGMYKAAPGQPFRDHVDTLSIADLEINLTYLGDGLRTTTRQTSEYQCLNEIFDIIRSAYMAKTTPQEVPEFVNALPDPLHIYLFREFLNDCPKARASVMALREDPRLMGQYPNPLVKGAFASISSEKLPGALHAAVDCKNPEILGHLLARSFHLHIRGKISLHEVLNSKDATGRTLCENAVQDPRLFDTFRSWVAMCGTGDALEPVVATLCSLHNKGKLTEDQLTQALTGRYKTGQPLMWALVEYQPAKPGKPDIFESCFELIKRTSLSPNSVGMIVSAVTIDPPEPELGRWFAPLEYLTTSAPLSYAKLIRRLKDCGRLMPSAFSPQLLTLLKDNKIAERAEYSRALGNVETDARSWMHFVEATNTTPLDSKDSHIGLAAILAFWSYVKNPPADLKTWVDASVTFDAKLANQNGAKKSFEPPFDRAVSEGKYGIAYAMALNMDPFALAKRTVPPPLKDMDLEKAHYLDLINLIEAARRDTEQPNQKIPLPKSQGQPSTVGPLGQHWGHPWEYFYG